MFRIIRCGIVATLAMAALVIPECPPRRFRSGSRSGPLSRGPKPSRSRSSCPRRRREYEQALDLARQHLGPEDITTAAVMNSLAELYYAMGRYAEAEPLVRRSLEVREKQLRRRPPQRGHQPEQPGGPVLCHRPVRRGRAALQTQPQDPGGEARARPPGVALSLNNLAELYRAMGRYAEAEPLYRRSLEVREKRLGPDHPHVATSLNDLASLYEDMGRYAEAEPLDRRSLKITRSSSGPTTPK